LVRASES